MNVSLIVLVVCAAWVAGTYVYFYNRKKKLLPMIIGTGVVRSDDEVLVRLKPVIVNVVFETGQPFDHLAVADVVINYRDLQNGKYNFQSSVASTGEGSKSVKYRPAEEEGKSFAHDDESPVEPYSQGPKKEGEGDDEDEEEDHDDEVNGAPELTPAPENDDDIPESDEIADSLTPNTIMDLKSHNFNI